MYCPFWNLRFITYIVCISEVGAIFIALLIEMILANIVEEATVSAT